MYQPPIPVDEDKQCCDCKYYDYGGDFDLSVCLAKHGYGEWHTVDSAGTCEDWEVRGDEKT